MRAREKSNQWAMWAGVVLSLFTASTASAQLSLLSPNGGESWAAGSTHVVRWTSTLTQGDVVIYATNLTTGSVVGLGYAPISAGALNWIICPLFGDGPSIITISTDADGGYEDTSDAPFTITDSATNVPIVVTSPNGGESFLAGSSQTITWTGGGPGQTVEADLLKDSDWMYVIGTAPVEAGALPWNVCPDLPQGDDYIVDLRTSGCGDSTEDVSDAGFSINDPSPEPTVTVTSPNGGESLAAGGTCTVTWVGTGLEGDAQVSLLTDTDSIYLGAAPTLTGNFQWSICNLLPTAQNYRIQVRAQGCWMSAQDESDSVFSITGGGTGLWPTMDLTYPRGGETWVAGSSHMVTWNTTQPNGKVRVVLYDGTQNVIDVLVAMAAGRYTMTLPGDLTPGSDYQVSLSWYGCGPELYDASARFFVISPGDLDGDGDVDLDDYILFRNCLSGPAVRQFDPACSSADLDQDGDVDEADFGLLQRCFSGSGHRPKPDCLH